jgi:hypothetical protein
VPAARRSSPEINDADAMVRNWGGGVLEGDMMTLAAPRRVLRRSRCRARRHLADLMQMEIVMEG